MAKPRPRPVAPDTGVGRVGAGRTDNLAVLDADGDGQEFAEFVSGVMRFVHDQEIEGAESLAVVVGGEPVGVVGHDETGLECGLDGIVVGAATFTQGALVSVAARTFIALRRKAGVEGFATRIGIHAPDRKSTRLNSSHSQISN